MPLQLSTLPCGFVHQLLDYHQNLFAYAVAATHPPIDGSPGNSIRQTTRHPDDVMIRDRLAELIDRHTNLFYGFFRVGDNYYHGLFVLTFDIGVISALSATNRHLNDALAIYLLARSMTTVALLPADRSEPPDLLRRRLPLGSEFSSIVRFSSLTYRLGIPSYLTEFDCTELLGLPFIHLLVTNLAPEALVDLPTTSEYREWVAAARESRRDRTTPTPSTTYVSLSSGDNRTISTFTDVPVNFWLSPFILMRGWLVPFSSTSPRPHIHQIMHEVMTEACNMYYEVVQIADNSYHGLFEIVLDLYLTTQLLRVNRIMNYEVIHFLHGTLKSSEKHPLVAVYLKPAGRPGNRPLNYLKPFSIIIMSVPFPIASLAHITSYLQYIDVILELHDDADDSPESHDNLPLWVTRSCDLITSSMRRARLQCCTPRLIRHGYHEAVFRVSLQHVSLFICQTTAAVCSEWCYVLVIVSMPLNICNYTSPASRKLLYGALRANFSTGMTRKAWKQPSPYYELPYQFVAYVFSTSLDSLHTALTSENRPTLPSSVDHVCSPSLFRPQPFTFGTFPVPHLCPWSMSGAGLALHVDTILYVRKALLMHEYEVTDKLRPVDLLISYIRAHFTRFIAALPMDIHNSVYIFNLTDSTAPSRCITSSTGTSLTTPTGWTKDSDLKIDGLTTTLRQTLPSISDSRIHEWLTSRYALTRVQVAHTLQTSALRLLFCLEIFSFDHFFAEDLGDDDNDVPQFSPRPPVRHRLPPHPHRLLTSFLDFYIAALPIIRQVLPHHVFGRLSWVRALWFLQLHRLRFATTTNHRGLQDLFFNLDVQRYTLRHHLQSSVVYIKISHKHPGWYIGSTIHTITDREVSRRSKYNQLCSGTQAFFEPALRIWHAAGTYDHHLPITLQHRPTEEQVRALEQALIATYHPHLNAPFVYTFLRKLGVQLEAPMVVTFLEGGNGARLLRAHHRYTHYRDLPELLGTRSLIEQRETLATIIQYVGSNGILKFFSQRVLRRNSTPIAYLYLLVRFLVFVDEEISRLVTDYFLFLSWLMTFYDKLNTGWTAIYFITENGQRTPSDHVAAPADVVLNESIYRENMSDGRWLTKSQFRRFTVAPLNRWFKLWRQPDQSLLRWQVFVSHQWQLHSQTLRMRPDGRQLRELKNLRESSEHIVISPIDHGPHLAYAFCPQQYFDILTKTFLDPAVFWRRDTNPMQLSEHIQRAIKRHVPTRYHWALAPKESLPYAYVLPKPSKQFLKGRPIVSYSNTWCATLAKFLSTAVLQMLQTVVPPQFVSPTVHSIIQTFIHAFRNNPVTVELQLLQQDLSGFFTSVPHDRIYHSISSLTDMFARHQQIPLDSDIQITMLDRNSLGRLFRGRYRKAGSHYKPLCLRDLPSLVMFLLRHSFFTVGTEILVQHRGASMGSPMAPSICGATAALWEATFHQLIRDQMLTSRYFCSSRYVDNRCLLRIWDGELESLDDCQRHHSRRGHDPLSSSSTSSYGWFQEVYLHPHFYGLPLELEHVPGQELLGTVVDTAQRTLRDLPRGFISFADYPGPKPSLHLKFVNLFIYIVKEVKLPPEPLVMAGSSPDSYLLDDVTWTPDPDMDSDLDASSAHDAGLPPTGSDVDGDPTPHRTLPLSPSPLPGKTTQQTPSTTSPPYYLLFFHIVSTFQGHVNIIVDIFIVFILFFVPHYGTTNSGPTYLLVPFKETSTEDTFQDQHYHSSDRIYTSHDESSLSNSGRRAELH
ncbi:unnamed protein product [Symbiodinium sp. CCMP2592]|nr:unnamed protein product [Symbiodinium sp. CCMP2592]